MLFARRKLHVGIIGYVAVRDCRPAIPPGQSVIPTLAFVGFSFVVDRFTRRLAPASAHETRPAQGLQGFPERPDESSGARLYANDASYVMSLATTIAAWSATAARPANDGSAERRACPASAPSPCWLHTFRCVWAAAEVRWDRP